MLQEPPHLSSAQDGINAIREEQDLEDSGAYGTTPSRYDATLKKNQEIEALKI